jgi:hypothetical protein
MPIDFSGPVNFFVIAGQGNIREYRVSLVEYTNAPRLLGFRFAKYDNAELITDAVPVFMGSALEVTALYPVEMPSLSFALIPSFEILGDNLEIEGVEIISGQTVLQFDRTLNVSQRKIITVWRDGQTIDYTLTVTFREDPDSIRSITDFRFTRADNGGISANAVASIVNDGDYGTITVQVLYTGSRPSLLRPRFISPGTVRVGGAPQVSGIDSQNFSQPLVYRVTSRNMMFTREYTVQVYFIHLSTPRMLSFGLSREHNPGLLRNSVGNISGGHIVVDVHFGGTAAPEILIPQFRAEGIVTVLGSVQVSGVSPQNFSRRITYRVTHPLDSTLWQEYSVQTRLVRDTSSDALITSFYFHPDENPRLSEPLVGLIQQGRISVFAPVGFGVYHYPMIPRFTATGPVSVGGVEQHSGHIGSGRVFANAVEYMVVSPNGARTMRYTVTVREMPSPRIFVNHRAAGWNDGTSWQNAFRCLAEATEAAAMFPDDVQKEIWIAEGMYTPGVRGHFLLTPNTRFIGGFAGGETSVGQRNLAANRTILTGSSGALFAPSGAQTISGDISFENLEFTNAASGITARMAGGAEVSISASRFTDLRGTAIYITSAGDIEISDVYIGGITGGSGILIRDDFGGSGNRVLSGIIGEDIGGTGVSMFVAASANITLYDVNLQRIGGPNAILISGGNIVNLTEVRVTDVQAPTGTGISVTNAGILTVDRSHVINTGGTGMSLTSRQNTTVIRSVIEGASVGLNANWNTAANQPIRTLMVYGTSIRNTRSTGLNIAGVFEDVFIYNDTIIENTEGSGIQAGTFGVSPHGRRNLTIRNSTIRNTTMAASGNGGGLNFTPGVVNHSHLTIYRSYFENNRAGGVGGAVNFTGAEFTIEYSHFINSTAGGSAKIFNSNGAAGTFRNNRFIHDGRLVEFSPYTNSEVSMFRFSNGPVIFDGCRFYNLTSNNPREVYIFNRFWRSPGHPAGFPSGITHTVNTTTFNLTLRNTTFNFRPDSRVGLLALHGGQQPGTTDAAILQPDRLLMDGVTINSTTSQQPLIWLHNVANGTSTPGVFEFRPTNRVNGTLLHNEAALLGLGNNIRLGNPDSPRIITMVP